jgi:hypothetical protein
LKSACHADLRSCVTPDLSPKGCLFCPTEPILSI